ncbi:Hypothetical protein FKW44_017444 [Caligus rogercresseyi]|uniref:Uncharacterized protein n=1 Tax=Caligus rogercresseyi TaxID=217165 RepID=A0A7T8JX84_CALRO|nr:Hypothetical protein FKW44_017444 [Caligus rogercresseyi]
MKDNYAEDEDSHAVFVKSINACSVKYEPAKRSLRVVSTDEDTQRKSRHDPGHALSKLHKADPERGLHHQPGAPGRDLDLSMSMKCQIELKCAKNC